MNTDHNNKLIRDRWIHDFGKDVYANLEDTLDDDVFWEYVPMSQNEKEIHERFNL